MPTPTFRQLPLDPSHPPHSAWGVWGKDDRLGTLNHLTPERVVEAARQVRSGVRIRLDLPLKQNFLRPGFRPSPVHEIYSIGDNMHVSRSLLSELCSFSSGMRPGHHEATPAFGYFFRSLLLLTHLQDDKIHFNTQTSSQWDGFGHCGYSTGQFYNGVTAAQIQSGASPIGIEGK